jgi:hypothetical protein
MPESEDRVLWRWAPTGQYSAHSAYLALFTGQSAILGTKEIWKVKAPSKCKFFQWLIAPDRCWTAERRHRHGLQHSALCALCAQEDGTADHLVVGCVYAREVWFRLLGCYGWQSIAPAQPAGFAARWLHARKRVFRKGRKAFDSLVTLAAWQCMFLKKMRVCFLSYLNETRAMHVFEKILISLQSIPGMDYFSLNCFPTVFRRSFLYIGLQRKLQYWSKVHGPNFLNHFCVK